LFLFPYYINEGAVCFSPVFFVMPVEEESISLFHIVIWFLFLMVLLILIYYLHFHSSSFQRRDDVTEFPVHMEKQKIMEARNSAS